MGGVGGGGTPGLSWWVHAMLIPRGHGATLGCPCFGCSQLPLSSLSTSGVVGSAGVTPGPERAEGAVPRGHSHGNVLLADGELYTGTVSSFQGNDPAISRSQSLRPTKTESSLNWLQGEVLPTHPVGSPRSPGRGALSLQGREHSPACPRCPG